jgi:hypothetical protein
MRQQMNAIEQTMLLHDQKKLDDHFGGRPDHDLSLPPLLGIVHALESIIQHTDSHHPHKFKLLKKVTPNHSQAQDTLITNQSLQRDRHSTNNINIYKSCARDREWDPVVYLTAEMAAASGSLRREQKMD